MHRGFYRAGLRARLEILKWSGTKGISWKQNGDGVTSPCESGLWCGHRCSDLSVEPKGKNTVSQTKTTTTPTII